MKISFEYSYAEYHQINENRYRLTKFPRIARWCFLAVVIFNFFFGAIVLYLAFDSGKQLEIIHFLNIGLGILLLILRYLISPLMLRNYYKQQMVDGKIFNFDFKEDGFSVKGENIDVQQKWPAIILAHETKEHLLLWISKIQAYSIPKTAFVDSQEIQTFRKLIADNVENQELIK